jgi:hypothetical protein
MNTYNPLRFAAALGASVAAAMLMNYTPAMAQEPSRLPDSVMESAGAYSLYMRSAGDISARFTDGPSVAKSLKVGAAYEPKQLARGAVGFAAIVALQDDRYVREVRQLAERHGGAEAFAAKLASNPYYAATVPGSERTAMVVARALGAEGERVRQVGARVKLAAYEVQREDWSKADVTGRTQRLADAKALSAKPLRSDGRELALALNGVGEPGAFRLPVSTAKPQMSPVVARGLALAALAAMGEVDDAAMIEQISSDPECNTCLRMSKLNLFQCLAVSKPWYEDVFCLGQHVLIDTGECIYAASGSPRTAMASLDASAARRRDE